MPDAQTNYHIARYARKILHLRSSNVMIECKIWINGTYHKVLGRAKAVSHRSGCQTADVAIMIGPRALLVINHDGRIHDKRRMKEQDSVRDYRFTKAGIKCVTMRSSLLREKKLSIQEYLEMKLSPLRQWIEAELDSASFPTSRLWRLIPRITACAAGAV